MMGCSHRVSAPSLPFSVPSALPPPPTSASEPMSACTRETDGAVLRVGDEVYFERSADGTCEAGYVIALTRQENTVLATCRYKDRAWASPSYDETQDVNKLMLLDQLLSKGRTKRCARPIPRYAPSAIKPQSRSGSGTGNGMSKEELKKRRLRRLQKEKKRRREEKRRKKELTLKLLSSGIVDLATLTEEEQQELMRLTGVATTSAILEALNMSDSEVDDDPDEVLSDESSASSVFPESDSEATGNESDGNHSDVSTDSCPSEPDWMYWSRVRNPDRSSIKEVAFARYGVCPKCDSSDSDDSDEEELHTGLTNAVVSWSRHERSQLLQEYLKRRRSVQVRAETGAFTYKEWCLVLHIISEDSGGLEALERSSAIKGVKCCDGRRTMYGAIRAPLIQEMIRFAGVTKEDRFIDLGSGLGTVVLQMAAVTGCRATGIELEASRYTLSAMLHEDLIELTGRMELEPVFIENLKSRILLINDDVRAHEQKILDSTVIYFNNHGVWFDETLSKEGEISVEHWVAKLFAKTAVGTRLIILKSIPHLKGDWFQEGTFMARSEWLTWARDGKPLFCYTKLKNTWMCEKCGHENPIVSDDDTSVWEMKCENKCPSRAQTLRTKQIQE